MSNVQLGDRVRDIVTGCEGIATARIRYLTRCDEIAIESYTKTRGAETVWVDVTRVRVLTKSYVQFAVEESTAAG